MTEQPPDNRDYVTLEVKEYLPTDKYAALRKCTVDGRSRWDPERRVNVYRIDVRKIREAEEILGRKITITREVVSEVRGETGERETFKLNITYDVVQKLIIVIVNDQTHKVPFDHVDFVWNYIKKAGVTTPAKIFRALEELLGLPKEAFLGIRRVYFLHYYWPLVALKGLGLVKQYTDQNKTLSLTQQGIAIQNWEDTLGQKEKCVV